MIAALFRLSVSDVEPALTIQQHLVRTDALLHLSHIAAVPCTRLHAVPGVRFSFKTELLASVCYYCIGFDLFFSDSSRSYGALGAVDGRPESS